MWQKPAYRTVDGLGLARALKLVVAALKAERAVILRPPTAARIVLAKRPTRVTRTVARVQLDEQGRFQCGYERLV